jgi:hypothetical protein
MAPRKNILTWFIGKTFDFIKLPLELRASTIRMYENVISKFKRVVRINMFISMFKNTKGWSKVINCDIIVKQGCPLSPSLFGIYIDKLEDCVEKIGCVHPTLTGIVINIYVDDIFLMARSPHDLEYQLIILK